MSTALPHKYHPEYQAPTHRAQLTERAATNHYRSLCRAARISATRIYWYFQIRFLFIAF